MNPHVESHEPTPEFRAHLEWQIETALRRETRLSAPVSGRVHQVGLVLIVLAALATGGVVGIASGRVQDARQRDQLIEAANSEESVVRLRLELAQANFQDSRKRFDAGTVGRETVLAAEQQMRAMMLALARIQLDIDEIRTTSATPRNDLDAPLVGRRDFVRERLELDLQAAQYAMESAEKSAVQAAERFKVGVAPKAPQLQAEADLAQARARMQQLMVTIELRQRYLRGEIKREALAPAARRSELSLQLASTQREIELVGARVGELRRQVAVGQASELDLKRSEVDLLEKQLDLKRIQQEIEALTAVRR